LVFVLPHLGEYTIELLITFLECLIEDGTPVVGVHTLYILVFDLSTYACLPVDVVFIRVWTLDAQVPDAPELTNLLGHMFNICFLKIIMPVHQIRLNSAHIYGGRVWVVGLYHFTYRKVHLLRSFDPRIPQFSEVKP
jgi:hypothetical protein